MNFREFFVTSIEEIYDKVNATVEDSVKCLQHFNAPNVKRDEFSEVTCNEVY